MEDSASSMVNVRLAAVRKMVTEAKQNGLLSAEEGASLTDVPNVRQSGTLFKLGIMVDRRLTALERMKAKGIDADQVTDLVLTHLDNDHAGGLHDFPNATVHVSKEELSA